MCKSGINHSLSLAWLWFGTCRISTSIGCWSRSESADSEDSRLGSRGLDTKICSSRFQISIQNFQHLDPCHPYTSMILKFKFRPLILKSNFDIGSFNIEYTFDLNFVIKVYKLWYWSLQTSILRFNIGSHQYPSCNTSILMVDFNVFYIKVYYDTMYSISATK